ncbi:MAG: VCBS repeat-containing protein, partial [Phycisphaerales bacterium]|nr:VCBS repeat-containing protein [Phycisphaerales bacterium]
DTDTTREILAGDVDGDGDVDLICVNAGQDRLYLNDGTGRFSDATRGRLPVEFSDVFAAASHDFDGDGDLDLMLGGRWLYLNDGAGVFTDVSGARMPPLQDHSASIGVVDVDRDGDLDVVLGTRGPLLPRPPNLLLLNHNGSFTVAPATRFPVDQGSYSLLTGDIDADGDADVLFTSVFYPYVRAYLNLERQVFAPRVLQPGRPYTLQFYARAGYATGPQRVVPFVGFDRLAPQPIRFPDWGAFRLVVNQVVQLPVLAIPFPTERLAVDLVVPSELDASRLYIQALVLHSPSPTDWGFSNVLHLQR